jgi:hypothetical protein
MVDGNWPAGHSRAGAFHCSRSHYGSYGWSWSWRIGWRYSRALIGMGIPEYEANRYEGRIKEGGILLSVHADDRDWKNKGKEILERTGAEDIGYKGESDADSDETDRPYATEKVTAGVWADDGGAEYKRTDEPVKPSTIDPLA